MIYSLLPFSTEKEIGRAYNAHCEIVPDGNYILIRDYDTLILDSRAFDIMEKAINHHPDTDIFSCYASRIGYDFQRLTPRIEENDSIKFHMEIAKGRADLFPNGECVNAPTIAGFFMLFRKEYWKRNPFQPKMFDDSGRLFDRTFAIEAMKHNRIKLIRGIYLWHTYRLGKGARDTSHLGNG